MLVEDADMPCCGDKVQHRPKTLYIGGGKKSGTARWCGAFNAERRTIPGPAGWGFATERGGGRLDGGVFRNFEVLRQHGARDDSGWVDEEVAGHEQEAFRNQYPDVNGILNVSACASNEKEI